MKANITHKRLWFYPMLFGFLGMLIGLVLRYAFTGGLTNFPLKNVLHSHSHVMLLGFIFNGLAILVWTRYTDGIDKTSYKLYLALQVCIVGMLITFIIQGYALFSITFSTLHLWLSYIFLIRLWRRLRGHQQLIQLIKIGVVFHFLSSIGPYCLGPLMAMDMQESPWYQQAIFFYLHFQYFGVLFIWLLALLLQRSTVLITSKTVTIIALSLIGLYVHSLDYNFNHWTIQTIGSISALALFLICLRWYKGFLFAQKSYRFLYFIVLTITLCNILGSVPTIADLVVTERFILIAWLHALFLGLFTPFIWVESQHHISKWIWISYAILFTLTELILVFPSTFYSFTSIAIPQLLFLAYLGMFICISVVHLTFLFKSKT